MRLNKLFLENTEKFIKLFNRIFLHYYNSHPSQVDIVVNNDIETKLDDLDNVAAILKTRGRLAESLLIRIQITGMEMNGKFIELLETILQTSAESQSASEFHVDDEFENSDYYDFEIWNTTSPGTGTQNIRIEMRPEHDLPPEIENFLKYWHSTILKKLNNKILQYAPK